VQADNLRGVCFVVSLSFHFTTKQTPHKLQLTAALCEKIDDQEYLIIEDMNIKKIQQLISESRFIQAYELISLELMNEPKNELALELSRILSENVRSRCIALASNKATEMSNETYETEALLRVIIRLNGETIYGKP